MAVTADIQQQVFDLLSRASNISFVTAEQEPGAVSSLIPGQRVIAEILQQKNNLVQVKVGNERYNLELPVALRSGRSLEMTFISAEPRVTFAVSRPAAPLPPVTISEASRLLSLLIPKDGLTDPALRSSLQSISNMMKGSSGGAAVLASLLDDAIIYGAPGNSPKGLTSIEEAQQRSALSVGGGKPGAFESGAVNIVRDVARDARFITVQASAHPVTPLPFRPGDEVNATVAGTLPGGRTFVQMAGSSLELLLPHKAQPGEILRLTYLAAEPKPTFALPRALHEGTLPALSEAGRWLSVLEHSPGGVSRQQTYVLERLNSVLTSIPPGSPAFDVIADEAALYGRDGQRSGARAEATVPPDPRTSPPAPLWNANGVQLNDDMAKLLQGVIRGNRLVLLEALNPQTALQYTPGQQMKGEVLASLGGGRFSVMVGETAYEFSMPKGTRRGDRLNLFYISGEPGQVFLMVRFGRHADARLSETGRWLSSFLGEASGKIPAEESYSIFKALLAEPTTDASLLGKTLQQGLRQSGLFYEAHLARWFGGEYPLADILKEPQGALSPRLNLDHAPDHRPLQMVGEQLATLQTGQLLFHGELFPGQDLRWTVAERDGGRSETGEQRRSWETSVTITLPHLGEVSTKVVLDSATLRVSINAADSSTVPLLESGRSRLIEQIDGIGLTAAELEIAYGGS